MNCTWYVSTHLKERADAEEQRNQQSRNQEESDAIKLDQSKGTWSSLLESENYLCTALETCWSCFWDFSQAVEMSNFLCNVGLWALLRRNSYYDPGKKVENQIKSKTGDGFCDRLCCWLLWSWEACTGCTASIDTIVPKAHVCCASRARGVCKQSQGQTFMYINTSALRQPPSDALQDLCKNCPSFNPSNEHILWLPHTSIFSSPSLTPIQVQIQIQVILYIYRPSSWGNTEPEPKLKVSAPAQLRYTVAEMPHCRQTWVWSPNITALSHTLLREVVSPLNNTRYKINITHILCAPQLL